METVHSSKSDEVTKLIDKHYRKSAGLWCETCDQSGSHSSDHHSLFADGAMKLEEAER